MAEHPPQPKIPALVCQFMRQHPDERADLLQTGTCRTDGHGRSSGPMQPEVQLTRKGLEVGQHTPASWRRECAYHLHMRQHGYGNQHDTSNCGGCPPAPDREILTQLVPWTRVIEILKHEERGAGLQCADLDLDAAELEHAEHQKRGARTLIARASRLTSQDAPAAELEGLRVEILSYRDQLPDDTNTWRIARERLGAAALKCAQHRDRTRASTTTLEQLAHQAAAFTTCACGQTFTPYSGSARCQACETADRDQGSQLGIFDMAPTAPARTYKAPTAPQPQGLF